VSASAFILLIETMGRRSCCPSSMGRAAAVRCLGRLTFTCQTLWLMSYEPGPTPNSSIWPPMYLLYRAVSSAQTAREKSPAPTRYNRQVETTRKICSRAVEPPLSHCQTTGCEKRKAWFADPPRKSAYL
jgi:hypothetical protein